MKTIFATTLLCLIGSAAHATLSCEESDGGVGAQRGIFNCETDQTNAFVFVWSASPPDLLEGGAPQQTEILRQYAPYKAIAYCRNRRDVVQSTQTVQEEGTVEVAFPVLATQYVDPDTGASYEYIPGESTPIVCRALNDSPVQLADSGGGSYDGLGYEPDFWDGERWWWQYYELFFGNYALGGW